MPAICRNSLVWLILTFYRLCAIDPKQTRSVLRPYCTAAPIAAARLVQGGGQGTKGAQLEGAHSAKTDQEKLDLQFHWEDFHVQKSLGNWLQYNQGQG
jgi:hypothetical protein